MLSSACFPHAPSARVKIGSGGQGAGEGEGGAQEEEEVEVVMVEDRMPTTLSAFACALRSTGIRLEAEPAPSKLNGY